MNELDVDVITTEADLERCREEWQEFLLQDSHHSIFHNPVFLKALMQTFGAQQAAYFVILRETNTENLSKIVAIAPFILNQSSYMLKFGLLRLFGIKLPRVLLLGNDILIAKQYGNAAGLLAKILIHLKSRKIAMLNVDCLRTDSWMWPELQSAQSRPLADYRFVVKDSQPLRGIQLESDFEQYLAGMSKKVRYNFKRTVSQFEKKTGFPPKITAVRDAQQVPAFMADLDQVFKTTWQASSFGYAMRNTSTSISQHEQLATAGLLRSYVLYLDSVPVAYIRGYQYAGNYYYEEIGFDKRQRDLEPGTVLNFLVLQDLFVQDKPEYLDFGFGENDYKRKLGNYAIDACEGFLVCQGSKAQLVVGIQRALQAAYRGISRAVKAIKMDTLVRRMIKRR